MKIESVVVLLFAIIVISLTTSCGVMRWNECRRVHPFWYCASQK